MARSKSSPLVILLDHRRIPSSAGNKACQLQRLIQKGLRVPQTYLIPWEAYGRYLKDDPTLVDDLRQQLARMLDPAKSYAVRSSANIEDTREHSFAGQFKTTLGAQGVHLVFTAIWSIWATASSAGVRAYTDKHAGQAGELRMAVIVQEMVQPVISGVAFSRNPITGEDEVIVEAVQGPGTALVQQGFTPFRWVHQSNQWKSQPQVAPIETDLIQQVVNQTRLIATTFRMEVDLEWVFDGQDLYWVQMREITSLKDLTIYSNRIAREVLPGMIKPLVWSVNVPLINQVWVEVFTELVGKNDLKFDNLARSFYFRAYFNLSELGRIWGALGMPRESLEMMMGVVPRPAGGVRFKPTWSTLRLTPRLLRFFFQKWDLGKRFTQDYPGLLARFAAYDWRQAQDLRERALWAEINRLYNDLHEVVYYNINLPLLMGLYTSLLGRYLNKAGVELSQLELMEGMDEHLQHAPDIFLRELQQEFATLDPGLQERIDGASFAEFMALPRIASFRERFTAFLDRFGHLSDSGNDFSAIPWRERPEIVLGLVVQGAGNSGDNSPLVSFDSLKLTGWNRFWGKLFYQRARLFRLYREQISSLFTYAYGLFRPYFLVLGSHFAARGWLFEPGDIFYLERSEIQALVESPGQPPRDFAGLARARKAEMQNCLDIQLPALIYGEAAPVLLEQTGEKLSGVPTSRGFYKGPARIVCGLEDFKKVLAGDVLVVPYSDVGWTPLFARAGAVIAESGGILSHSSIIAREYRIPAVVSVSGAMRLRDAQLVTVDGFRGEVILHVGGTK